LKKELLNPTIPSREILAILLTDTHLQESTIQKNWLIFRQTVDFCKSHNISTIYHLGDIFQSRKSQSQLVLNTFKDILDYLKSAEIILVCIPSNHDKTDYASERSFLDSYEYHPAFTLISLYYNFEIKDGVVIHFLPFFDNHKYIDLMSGVESTFDNTKVNILFTHIGITGSVMNNGVKVEGISQSLFDRWDLTLVGHYHDPQVLPNNIYYIGSSLQTNFGEYPEKGLTILYDDLSLETVELEYPRFRKLEVDVTKLTTSEIELLKQEKDSTNDSYKVILCGKEKDVKSFNKQLLLNVGIAVENKIDQIEIQEIQQQVKAYTPTSLIESFEEFCKRDGLDLDQGKEFLMKSLNV